MLAATDAKLLTEQNLGVDQATMAVKFQSLLTFVDDEIRLAIANGMYWCRLTLDYQTKNAPGHWMGVAMYGIHRKDEYTPEATQLQTLLTAQGYRVELTPTNIVISWG